MVTVESIATVTLLDPSKLVPLKPVPMVNALVVLDLIVALLPSAIELPFTVMALFSSALFGIADKRELDSVPLVLFVAFVVSVVADVASVGLLVRSV